MKKTVSVLIKPASGTCNMQCTYCFYCAETGQRTNKLPSFMSRETIQIAVRKLLDYADGGEVYLAFQGGEPLLSGLSFYEAVVETVCAFNVRKSRVFYSLQTNDILLDEAYAAFFAKYRFLIGVSLDGTKETHDIYRRCDGGGTFSDVMRGIELLKKYGVEFNILTVVTNTIAENIEKIYAFYKERDFRFLQFIPYIPPKRGQKAKNDILSAEKFGLFLLRIFDLWREEIESGGYRSILHLDQTGSFLLGYPYTSCNMRGVCVNQLVIESDGSVYPCDFYAGEEYSMGNILQDSVQKLMSNRLEKQWREGHEVLRGSCSDCEFFSVCRGGCARYYAEGKHIYCDSYKRFYAEKLNEFRSTVRKIRL